MAHLTLTGARKRAAAFAVAAASTLGAGLLLTGVPAHAQPLPLYKSCTGTNADGTSQPGTTTTCSVMATVPAATGAEYQTHLVGPGASFVIACEGATGVSTGSGPVSNTCTFTVTAATVAPNTQVGTETIHIDLAAAAGSSLSQTGQYCGTIPPLSTTPTCLPTGLQDVSTIGNGSCVGSGQTVNPLGGCLSASGLPTLPGTTTSPSPSNSAGGTTPTPSSSSGTGGNGSGSSGGKGGVAAASTTPFTGGPVHPFPLAATGLALGGLALAFAAAFGPAVNRRLRRSAVRKDSH